MSLIQGFLDGLRPEPRLSVSDWADRYRMLSSTASAEPGQWRTSRTPYLRQIMDNLSSTDPCREVVFMKGAQVGATEMGFNWVGYVIDVSPGPMLLVQPTLETLKRASKTRFDPMVEATPRLTEKIAPSRSRDSGNTTFQKDFPGGTVVLTGANSAVGLRSMPIRFLFLDEIDGYPLDLEGEGDPISLAEARTRTFARKKIFKVSTPTVEGRSVIEREFMNTDQRYFMVPCPHCQHEQALVFDNLKWDKGKPETALYFCEECGAGIEERFKTTMLAEGRWVAKKPELTSLYKAGYHLNSLYSPNGWYSWVDAARDWEDAQGDDNKLKTFTNTVLGLTWKEKGDAPEWQNLYNRREPYQLNRPTKEVAFLTAGVDVQKDRIEVEIVGWCRGKRSYSVDYRVLPGDTSSKAVWDALAAIVGEQWEREDGRIMPLRLMAVDTGFRTTEVYDFCQRFDVTRVIPVKGQDKQQLVVAAPKQIHTTSAGKKVGRVRIWNVGTSVVKSELYGWLKLELAEDGAAPPGYCHFPEYDQHFFRMLTAEQVQYRVVRGYPVPEWVKKYERNEALDCRVYARAAAAVVGIDRFREENWKTLESGYAVRSEAGGQQKRERRKSDFW